MDGPQICLLIVLLILVAFNALFSSTETTYSSVNMIRLKQMTKNGDRRTHTAYSTPKSFAIAIITILIENNMMNILTASTAVELFTQMLGSAGVTVVTGIMTVLTLTLGEIMLEIVVKAKTESAALFMAKPLSIMVLLFRSISFVAESTETHREKEMEIENVAATGDKFLGIIPTAEQEGVLEQEERESIESVTEFDDKNIHDIMVPRDRVAFLYGNATYGQMKQVLHDHRLSRLLVIPYRTTEVVGILRVRDVLDTFLEDKETAISEMMQEPVFIIQRKRLPVAPEDIQKPREHIAIIEKSLTSHVFVGIVTLEDVLEELVRKIYDEYDPLPNHVVEIGHHAPTIDGNVSLVDFFGTYVEDQDTPKTRARTFAAWVFELNNHRKAHGDREIKLENSKIRVLGTKDGMAARIKMQTLSQTGDDLD